MENKLNKLRKNINQVDNELISLLKKRIKFVKSIGKYKKINKIQIINKNREKEIILKVKNRAINKKEENYLVSIFDSIIKNSRKIQ